MRPMTWVDTLARTLFPDRCHQWRLGPFDTDWRCLKSKKHDGDHVYEPDCWVAGSTFESTWRLGEKLRAEAEPLDGSPPHPAQSATGDGAGEADCRGQGVVDKAGERGDSPATPLDGGR